MAKVKVNICGQDVEVEVPDSELHADFQQELDRAEERGRRQGEEIACKDIASRLKNELVSHLFHCMLEWVLLDPRCEHPDDELTDDELDAVLETVRLNISYDYELDRIPGNEAEAVIDQLMRAMVRADFIERWVNPVIEDVVNERAAFFRVPVQYTQTIEVIVKASTMDEAIEAVEDMSRYEFDEVIDAADGEIEVQRYDTTEIREVTPECIDYYDTKDRSWH